LTIRIHLDDCTKENGALRVIPKSFDKISDIKSLDSSFFENEKICEVKRGGIMLMKPLIWHSSKRTENQAKRRVIHIEFSNYSLSNNLEWAEFDRINY
jgi:ectoine hydroxylase-related dioxygenase (phytanoyl-CoA dioxygenase family)